MATRKELNKGIDANEGINRIWIDVLTFAEGIAGWRTLLMELLLLSSCINCTIVEPCMKNGKLGSCLNGGIPVSKIFDMSEALHPSDHRFPVLVPYNNYVKHLANAIVMEFNKMEYNICMSKYSNATTPFPPTRCPNSTVIPADIDMLRLRKIILGREKSNNVVLHLEDYWKGGSKMLGGNVKGLNLNELSFNPGHVQMVDKILRRSNITGDNFSIIHWRAEKKGMDFMECANAIINAKHAMEWTTAENHPFILITSLNKNASMMWGGSRKIANNNCSTVNQALDLLSDHGFLKFDELLMQEIGLLNDPGMLAIYDLILAQKSKGFASCAIDGGHGCSANHAVKLCNRCNHVGKFGKLAISLRKSSPEHVKKSSWGCWSQAPNNFHPPTSVAAVHDLRNSTKSGPAIIAVDKGTGKTCGDEIA